MREDGHLDGGFYADKHGATSCSLEGDRALVEGGSGGATAGGLGAGAAVHFSKREVKLDTVTVV